MDVFLVTHTHWDREWYRTFQSFRARLVDTIDGVLDLLDADPGFCFLLDGQTIVIEDYLAIRPQRRAALQAACKSGRLGIGPWYVQPDSLLPSGEAHVRNLLEGRRVGEAFGPVSRVAYTPDSFGHPAQFPQLFAGFGLEPFVYWRGNGAEITSLPAEYLWEAPDGSAVLAHHLWDGYFSAQGLPTDPESAAKWLEEVVKRLGARTRSERVLLLNGVDHAFPAAHTGAVAAALARRTGWRVQRALLDDFARDLPREAPRFRGELLGGRVANLLPGVWSTRTSLKLRNRRAEAVLEGWAEPWAALGHALGLPDERPALRSAWRALLQNQAHDSICGCSQDRVHEQMTARYDTAEELGRETTTRCLERLAGLGPARTTPWTADIDLAVFNPSPHPRTDVVHFALEPSSWFEVRGETTRELSIHPLLSANLTTQGWQVDGRPARVLADPSGHRVHLIPGQAPHTVEFVAADVPAFGWRQFRLRAADPSPDREDDGREVELGGIAVRVAEDGTFTVQWLDREYSSLCGVEDVGDRGDTYDFDPVTAGSCTLQTVAVQRRVHESGIRSLAVTRIMMIPARLSSDRSARAPETVPLRIETEARLVPGTQRIDLQVRVDNRAADHRLRLLFPTASPAEHFAAATTFDVARRSTTMPDATDWVHPAPTTFPHQGFVTLNGLTLAAPGLPEAEVTQDGVIALTVLRAVGWLARVDLRSRPEPAGPALATPGAQCEGVLEARLALYPDLDARRARDAELGLRAVVAGEQPLLEAGKPLLALEPAALVLSALKPAETGHGFVVRLLNPTDDAIEASIRVGLPLSDVTSVRLDESGDGKPVAHRGGMVKLTIGPHALRSVRMTPAPGAQVPD
jgi:mannosylglycerate hydrolase